MKNYFAMRGSENQKKLNAGTLILRETMTYIPGQSSAVTYNADEVSRLMNKYFKRFWKDDSMANSREETR